MLLISPRVWPSPPEIDGPAPAPGCPSGWRWFWVDEIWRLKRGRLLEPAEVEGSKA